MVNRRLLWDDNLQSQMWQFQVRRQGHNETEQAFSVFWVSVLALVREYLEQKSTCCCAVFKDYSQTGCLARCSSGAGPFGGAEPPTAAADLARDAAATPQPTSGSGYFPQLLRLDGRSGSIPGWAQKIIWPQLSALLFSSSQISQTRLFFDVLCSAWWRGHVNLFLLHLQLMICNLQDLT